MADTRLEGHCQLTKMRRRICQMPQRFLEGCKDVLLQVGWWIEVAGSLTWSALGSLGCVEAVFELGWLKARSFCFLLRILSSFVILLAGN